MMREDEDDYEVPRPPAPHEQRFDSRIEEDLGYEISDPDMKDRIAEEVYNPKPKAEFGFDPSVAPERVGQPLFTLTSYATNTGTLAEDEAEKPTNLVASSLGYVMPKTMGEAEKNTVGEEVEAKFGRKTPQDEEEEEEEESSSDEEEKKKKKKKKKKEKSDSPHKPYAQLDTLDEENEYTGNARSPKQRGGKGVDRIQVAVRLRPMTKDEMISKNKKKKEGGPEAFMAWDVDDDGDLDVIIQKGSRSKVEGKNMFHVDAVYEEQDTTDSLYADVCKPIMTAVLNGQHGTIFGYGQTGGGKSHTIQGGKGAKGIIQLAAKDLFQRISEDTRREYSVKASYFEIYNEQVRDLMGHDESDDPKSRRATAVITTVNKLDVDLPVLNIREDSKGGDVFVNAQFTKVTSVENIKRVLHKGNRNRATEKTKTNEFSSRSHAIFRLTVESHEPIPDDADMTEGVRLRVAALNFVDLAGSENSAKAATSGKTKREGGKINQSLLSLTQVIHQLSLPSKKRPKHINYRDSKLTRILQPHLSGNAAIAIICCCTPAKKMVEETRSTLKFAYNAKRIKLKPQVNEIVDDKVLIENLKKELQETKMKLQNLKEFQEKNPPAPEGGSEFPMIEKFFAQMNAHMNASVRSEDFVDALEEISGLSMGSGGGGADGGSPIPPVPPVPAAEPVDGNEDAPATPAAEEEDEDDVEAFRRQILAKFMSDMDIVEEDGGEGEGEDDGENADTTVDDTNVQDTTVGDTTIGDTTVGDTTMGDTTVGDTTLGDTTDGGATTGGETTDVDTSMNRTMTDETAVTQETQDPSGREEAKDSTEAAAPASPTKAPISPRKVVPQSPVATPSTPKPPSAPQTPQQQKVETPKQEAMQQAPSFATPPEIDRGTADVTKPGLPFAPSPKIETPRSAAEIKRSFIDSDESSASTPRLPPNESDLNLIERFREEILEKFRDEIVDEEAAHELDENAQNVAVIANELINKFKREIVYKYKDEFPELLVKKVEVDLAATPVGDSGIVGRVIERAAVGESPASEPVLSEPVLSEPVMNTSDDSSANGSVEQFEDEFDEDPAKLGNSGDAAELDAEKLDAAKLGAAVDATPSTTGETKPEPEKPEETKLADEDKPAERRSVPTRSFSTQTDRAVINGRPSFGLGAGKAPTSTEPDPPIPPVTSTLGRSTSGSISSDLSSDVADKKTGSAISPVPANPPVDTDDEDGLIPPGEIAISNGEQEPGPGVVEGKLRIKFLEEKLLATDELVETLFVELENAKTFIRELVFENAGGGGGALDPSGAALFGPAGSSGVTVVDEQILNQCEILKFAIYTSLLFFVFGQHELFLATVFFLWLSLEVATKT